MKLNAVNAEEPRKTPDIVELAREFRLNAERISAGVEIASARIEQLIAEARDIDLRLARAEAIMEGTRTNGASLRLVKPSET